MTYGVKTVQTYIVTEKRNLFSGLVQKFWISPKFTTLGHTESDKAFVIMSGANNLLKLLSFNIDQNCIIYIFLNYITGRYLLQFNHFSY